jgi:predicted GNAT family N-acyltransferase
MEVAHVDAYTEADRAQVRDGEEDPYGGLGLSAIDWRPRELHTVGRAHGRILVHVGLTLAVAEVAGAPLVVVGVGGVMVARSERGRGRLRPVLEAALARAETLGPERALLFCADPRVAMYARFGFARIAAPVTVDQADGATLVFPHVTMWRPLRAGAYWPPGPVRLRGLPF